MARTRKAAEKTAETTPDSRDWFVWDSKTTRAEGPMFKADADRIIQERLPHYDPVYTVVQLPVTE